MNNKNNYKPLLLISYFFGTKGCCPAEWADDKLSAICEDKNTILLTGIISREANSENVEHYTVPSLSLFDLNHELGELKREGRSLPYLKLLLWLPLILTVGLFLDIVQHILTSGTGGGKWSWAVPASIVSLFLFLRYRCSKVFTTGGPASAHLAGCFLKLFSNKKLICELQDPLTGEDIGRNSRSAKMLEWVERIIVRTADKVVYVTKTAAEYARSKYPGATAEIVAIYPGSRCFDDVGYNHEDSNDNVKELSLIHLGTLYSSRNLYSLIEAIDSLISNGDIEEGQIRILNLGEIYGDIKEHHLSRSYVNQEPIKPREEAIKVASKHMVSLLVQHADSRSNATIPYKTYDYINIGNPILALTNSNELYTLLNSNGHVPVNVHDIESIKTALLGMLNHYSDYKNKVKPFAINILEQTRLMVD